MGWVNLQTTAQENESIRRKFKHKYSLIWFYQIQSLVLYIIVYQDFAWGKLYGAFGIFSYIFIDYQIKEIVLTFGKFAYLLSSQKWDEKIYSNFMFV